ncbi:hypothetical protein D3C76_72760 [compost metagenome]
MRLWKKKAEQLRRIIPHMKAECGSALVLVMFVVLLLTILGLAVLSATVGGAQRSETRENDVQSLHLAQKGLSEATAYIQSQLKGLQPEGIDPARLETILQKLDNNKSSLKVTTELQSVSSAVEGIDLVDKQEGTQSIKYLINVSASASVNGVQRKLMQQIVIDSYPDFLKYVFGSEQTLRLNGTPQLQGNIYAGDKLVVTNTAEYIYKNTEYDETAPLQFPAVTANSAGTASGEVHVQSMDSIKYRENGAGETFLPEAGTQQNLILQEILHTTPDQIKLKEQKKFVQINVEESFYDKLIEGLSDPALGGSEETVQKDLRNGIRTAHEGGTQALNNWLNTRTEVARIAGMPVPPQKEQPAPDATQEEKDKLLDEYNSKLRNYKDQLKQLEELKASVIFNGDLLIDGLAYKKLFYPPNTQNSALDTKSGEHPRWFIVAGNLEIDNYTAGFMPVRANILVTGNVKIKGNVEFDSTMLVLGDTTVEDANIKGIRDSNGVKELVLISKGKVLVNRLDAFAVNKPSEEEIMEAFFYTDSSGELYGVGSMFQLKGGFFAKGDLTVNAVSGTVTEPSVPGKLLITTLMEPKRFVIDYKSDVYDHQQSSLPRVQTVNVHVGPLQLVN